MCLGTCRVIDDRAIILQDDGPPVDTSISFEGMSGGPIFSLKNNEGYSLIGVVYCGKGPLDDENIEISPDVWIFEFPFHEGLMGAILEYRS